MIDYSQDDYIKYRLERAFETLAEVEVLIDNSFWNTAVNRLYYACFYAVNALLKKYEIDATSHAGVRQKFGQYFVQKGLISKELAKHFTSLYEKRQKGDYNDFFNFEKEDVCFLVEPSRLFILKIEELINTR